MGVWPDSKEQKLVGVWELERNGSVGARSGGARELRVRDPERRREGAESEGPGAEEGGSSE